MPDKYGFDHLPNWGITTVACIEIGCTAKGPIYRWSEDRRLEHYQEHYPATRKVYDDFTDFDSLPTMRLGAPDRA